MDEKMLKIEKLKATIEKHKAFMLYQQTKISAGYANGPDAHHVMSNHARIIAECCEAILEIK